MLYMIMNPKCSPAASTPNPTLEPYTPFRQQGRHVVYGLGSTLGHCTPHADLSGETLGPFIMHMGGCQNYGPFVGTLNNRCRITIGTQEGTIILTTTHIYSCSDRRSVVKGCRCAVGIGDSGSLCCGQYILILSADPQRHVTQSRLQTKALQSAVSSYGLRAGVWSYPPPKLT